MLLTYTFPDFPDKIKSGIKRHTFRADPKKRWRKGMSIQHWFGSPRNIRAKVQPYFLGNGECYHVQEVIITRDASLNNQYGFYIMIAEGNDCRLIPDYLLPTIAHYDGLSIEEFREYFVPENSPNWKGRIIHFFDFKY